MKTVAFFALITLLSLAFLTQPSAKILFYADFEPEGQTRAVPGPEVNDPLNWEDTDSPNIIWDLVDLEADWPDTGREGWGLIQLTEGCGETGTTQLPGAAGADPNFFSDGVITLEMSWGDDDSFGTAFRETADDAGYFVVWGHNCVDWVILHDLETGCGEPLHCLTDVRKGEGGRDLGFPDMGCEKQPGNPDMAMHSLGAARLPWLEQVDTNPWQPIDKAGALRGNLPQDNSQVFLARIEAIGDSIKIWYMDMNDVPAGFDAENPDSTVLGKPMISVTDDRYQAGYIGMYQESQSNCIIDNFLITDLEGGAAVDARSKLSTYWGVIKDTK